jgi:hypothetical protein
MSSKKLPSYVLDAFVASGWKRDDGKRDDVWLRDGVRLVVAQASTNASMFSVEWSRLGLVRVQFLPEFMLLKVIDNGSF